MTATCPSCAAEHARRHRPDTPPGRPQITSPEAAADIVVPMIGNADREHCITLNLDTKHRLIATTTISIGSIDHTFISPRELFRDALAHGASALVVAHNHPSGDPSPSPEDVHVTCQIRQAGSLLDVDLLDHIVIGRQRYVSLKERGLGFD